jgi:serine-type D-Ala-D-Ala carboxypeptidase (penicillin-binding protein 5/6)
VIQMERRGRTQTAKKSRRPVERDDRSRTGQAVKDIDERSESRVRAVKGETEAERRNRIRKARRAKRERELRRQKRILALVCCGAAALLVVGAGFGIRSVVGNRSINQAADAAAEASTDADTAEITDSSENKAEDSGEEQSSQNAPYVFTETENTVQLGDSLTDISIYDSQRNITTTDESTQTEEEGTQEETSEESQEESASGSSDEDAALASDYVDSQYAILVNVTTGEILAERRAFERMVPASMTKVMTLLVAVEAMEDQEQSLKDTVTITREICDEAYLSGSSFVGYGVGDTATVEDLLYGTILPSGADAAMALAEYTAGSQEAFAEMMNQKAEELGISATTHFTNCVGLYDEDHYSTAYDMAVIMRAAADNELCRKVLSTHTWTTGALKDNPEGTTISNWFLRRIEDHSTGGTVLCGKTGFVNESGNCAVSYEVGDDGNDYIACTALTYNLWRCIYDHVALYKEYT